MEPATGALIASAIVGGIGAYGARSQTNAAAAAEDVASGGLISRTQAELANAAEKAKQLEAEVAKLKSEVARCQGLQSQLDALSGPELAFKNAKAEVLRRAGVEFLLPELVPFLPDAASIEKMKKVLDYPTELVDTMNRMTLRKFYETRVLKAVPTMAPPAVAAAVVVPAPAPAPAAAPAAPSEMDAELEALRGGRSRRARRSRRSQRSRRNRGGANGDGQAPAPAAAAPAPAAAPAAPENNALEAAADALPDAPPPAAAAPAAPVEVPPAAAAPAAPVEVPPAAADVVPAAPEQVPEQAPEVPEQVPAAPVEVPVVAPPLAGPAPVIGASAPLAKPFPDYATFAPMMARAIQLASVPPPAAAAAAAPGPPPAPAPAAAPGPVSSSAADDRIAKTAALVLADQIDQKLILPDAVAVTEDIERDRAVALMFRDRAANVTAAEWPGLKQEGEELLEAIEEHIDAAPGDQGMNAAEFAAADAVAPGPQQAVIAEAPARAPAPGPAVAAAAAPVPPAAAPDWRAALAAAAERRRVAAAAAAPAAAADVVPPAAVPVAPVAPVAPVEVPVAPVEVPVAPVEVPAAAPAAAADVVPEQVAAAPAVAAAVPEPAPAAPAALPPHLRGPGLARQPALSREAIEALRAQAPAAAVPGPVVVAPPAAPARQPGRLRQFVTNLTRKNRVVAAAAPAAPAAPAAAPVVAAPEPEPEPPAVVVDPIQAKQAEVDDLVRRLADIHAREASLFAAKRRIPKATTALRQMAEAQLEQAENTLRILKRNRAAAAGTGLLAAPVAAAPAPAPAPVAAAPAPAPAPAVAAPEMADGGIPEAPAAPAVPQTFAESAEAVRAIQEAQTPAAVNQFIVQAYRDSVEPPAAPENVAAVPAPVSALPPAPGATKLFGPLPGAQVGVRPEFAAAAAEGTRRAKRAQETRKTMRRPLTEVPVLPLTPTAARAMVGSPIAEDVPKFSRENPMAKGHMTLKKRLKEAPSRLTKTQYDALDADMKPHFTKEERKFPGLPDMYSRNAKRVINPEGGMRKRTLKNRRGLNKRKNVRGSRRR